MTDGTTLAGRAGRRRGNDLSGLSGGAAAAGRPLVGRRVLVAEDNVILSMHVADVLERAGATVAGPYPFVREALDALGDGAVDAAVLDHELMDGTSDALAERLDAVGVPYAYFTSHAARDLPVRGAPMVPKPGEARVLIDAIQGLLTGRA